MRHQTYTFETSLLSGFRVASNQHTDVIGKTFSVAWKVLTSLTLTFAEELCHCSEHDAFTLRYDGSVSRSRVHWWTEIPIVQPRLHLRVFYPLLRVIPEAFLCTEKLVAHHSKVRVVLHVLGLGKLQTPNFCTGVFSRNVGSTRICCGLSILTKRIAQVLLRCTQRCSACATSVTHFLCSDGSIATSLFKANLLVFCEIKIPQRVLKAGFLWDGQVGASGAKLKSTRRLVFHVQRRLTRLLQTSVDFPQRGGSCGRISTQGYGVVCDAAVESFDRCRSGTLVSPQACAACGLLGF